MGRGNGSGAFFLGVAMLVAGVGATVFSYMLAAPGGTYIVFGGLVVGGLIRIVTALLRGAGSVAFATGRNKNLADTERPAWYDDPNAEYVEKLADMPSGYCWQCGSRLRRGRTICMACGAAQATAAPERNSTATPGGRTLGPPPKQARSGHPYDDEGDPREAEEPDEITPPRRPRAFYPADPDGSYGWGPAYTQGQDRGSRSSPGAPPSGRAERAEEEERPPRPAYGRDNPRGGRPNAGLDRSNGGAALDRGLREPREDEPAPRRRDTRPETDGGHQRPRPRRPRADEDGWGAEADGNEDDDSREWRQSARRQAMRPRPRRPVGDDGGDWDGDDATPPRSPRGR
ncbi:MAG TPA: hypothetical protein VJN88_13195 [Ktedonobacterales bacterium]|nr:hypothetical protein [Ktedonobacterales bacterium]